MTTNHNFHYHTGNPVDELRSTIIWQRLNSMSQQRATQVSDFVRFIDPYLRSITNHFPLYTRHDAHHGYEVLERMPDVINPSLLQDGDNAFSEEELFCLIISAYAHDVGMTIFERGSERARLLETLGLPIDVEDTNEVLCSFLRATHAERGVEFLAKTDAGDFVPPSLRSIIGQIMMGHNLSPEDLITKIPELAAIGRRESNPRSLSIILCCADALEFSDTRVVDSAYYEAERRDDAAAQKSLIEMRKHQSIGCNMAINSDGFIIASGSFDDAETLHAVHTTLDQMENWIKKYIMYDLRQRRPVLRIKNHTIIREAFSTNGFKYVPVAIKIDEYQIRELLTSSRLWGNDSSIPIRELVQNAVDACRYKKHISSVAVEYEPFVEIIINKSEREITIRENGIGMDFDDITSFFLQIGKSKSRTEQFRRDPKNNGFHSLARFGVGFWSVFSIAELAEVETRFSNFFDTREGFKFKVSVNPVMRYLEIVTDNTLPMGTSVKLKIKKEFDFSRLIEGVVNLITSSNININIKDENDQLLHIFPNHLPPLLPNELFGYRTQSAIQSGIKWFSAEVDTENIEMRLGIAYSVIDDEVRCRTPFGRPMFQLIPNGSWAGVVTSICGFKTNLNLGPIPFAIDRVGLLTINIKSPNGIEYSFNRLSIEESKRMSELKVEILNCIATLLNRFYEQTGVLNEPNKIGRLISDSRSNGGDAGDSRTPNLYESYQTFYSNLVPVQLYKWEKNGEKLVIKEEQVFIEDFWSISTPVAYIPIWPDTQNLIWYINYFALHSQTQSGYILFASQEASAIFDVANGTLIKNLNFPYPDTWGNETSNYVEINPSAGYTNDDDKHLFSIQTSWSGSVTKVEFEQRSGTVPWMVFGRYRIFVDANHNITDYLSQLHSQGDIWLLGKVLSLMSTKDISAYPEIEKITGVKVNY